MSLQFESVLPLELYNLQMLKKKISLRFTWRFGGYLQDKDV